MRIRAQAPSPRHVRRGHFPTGQFQAGQFQAGRPSLAQHVGRALVVPALLLSTLAACTPWTASPRSAVAVLQPAQPSPDSYTLEIFFARFAYGQTDLNESLWNQIDEQLVPAETRTLLTRNGLRAGVLGGHIPEPLVQLLDLDTTPSPAPNHLEPTPLEPEPTVRRRWVQLGVSRHVRVAQSGIRDELPVLWYRRGHLEGETFREAQCMFALTAGASDEGGVQLRLVPEIRHGEPRQTYTTAEGYLRMEVARPKQVFEPLAIEVPLATGQMLVVGMMPEPKGSLGHHFFSTASSEGPQQQLLIIRLLRSPPPQWLDQ